MVDHTLSFISVSDMSTSAWFDSNTGNQFTAGSTITINTGATVSQLLVSDDDATFDDDDNIAQVLTTDQVLNGVAVTAGTMVETEYAVVFEDAEGVQYRMLAISLNNNAFTTYGFVFVGQVPPPGTTLTWVSSQDSQMGADPYNAVAAPACFVEGTRIATPSGLRAVETLVPGDMVLTRDCGARPLCLSLRQAFDFRPGPHPHKPVRIAAGALGPGLPARDLRVSPQHRMLVAGADGTPVLVPATALVGRPGIRAMPGTRKTVYVHLIFDRHQIVFAEGAPSESFLPARFALASLDLATRREVFALFPDFAGMAAITPAHPILRPGQARRLSLPLRAA